MIVPPINAKGRFKLAVPFDNILNDIEEYKVTAVRSITELFTDKPFENIYEPVGLTADDMKNDIENDIPIVVFLSVGEEYLYVPANKILTMPNLTGLKHQELMLALPLGLLPINYDLTLLKSNLADFIYDTLGTNVEPEIVETSTIVLLDNVESERLRLLRENRSTVKKSFRTKYYETLELLERKIDMIKKYEGYFKRKCNG